MLTFGQPPFCHVDVDALDEVVTLIPCSRLAQDLVGNGRGAVEYAVTKLFEWNVFDSNVLKYFL